MMRDFSKRQRSILDLILRLSWGCQHKEAYIPRQSDFEIVGVGRTHIRQELEWLCNAKVITWERASMTFSFNKDYDQWRVSIARGYDERRLRELLALNISYQNGNSELPKQEQEVTDSVTGVTETVTPELPKQELFIPANAVSEHVSGPPKTSIKTYNNIDTDVRSGEPGEDELSELTFALYGTGETANEVREFVDRVGREVVVEAMRLSLPKDIPKNYFQAVMRNCIRANVHGIESWRRHQEGHYGATTDGRRKGVLGGDRGAMGPEDGISRDTGDQKYAHLYDQDVG